MFDADHSTAATAADIAPGPAATVVDGGSDHPRTAAGRPLPLPLRNDTLLGVCEAIGQDFGFNPNILRIALALLLYVSPAGVIAVYLGLGAAVALSRWLYPDARAASDARQASVAAGRGRAERPPLAARAAPAAPRRL